MTGFARLLLVLTGLAPIALVQGAVSYELGALQLSLGCVGGALLLFVLCVWLLNGVAKIAPIPKKITSPDAKTSEPLAFLVAYALPLITAHDEKGSRIGLLVFAALMGLVILQEQLFQINPLLALIGYKFFSAKIDDDAHILILTRKRVLGSGILQLVQISDYLWLETGASR